MIAEILEVGRETITSPWVYLALFAFAAIDAFFPAVPSESLVITAGVFAAATGEPSLPLVIAASALGALVGDHVSYLMGRAGGGRLVRRVRPGGRRRAALDRTEAALAQRGGLILVVARYIPGGRTATTLTMGTVGYRLREFSLFATLAAVSWAAYSGLIGYLGGAAFEDDPLKGLLLGFGVAIGVTVVAEIVRHLRRRSRRGPPPPPPAAEEPPGPRALVG